MSSKPKPSRLEDEIENYAKEFLPPDPEKWAGQFRDKAKIIHDALWGTFGIRSHEVALLDTQLIQRLRFLHQTGAVYLTYPSAHHTRFEHTLGVLCQSGRLCTALRDQDGDGRVDKSFENDVRFAALLHDTGHGPFSHTSEQFFAGMPQMSEYRATHPELVESGAGEIMSYLLVKSKPFQDFVNAVNNVFAIRLNCQRIADIIAGAMSPQEMYASEIIHGPFDADKLDYMPRDGMFSGLKMHVDIDRLLHSIRIVKGKRGEEDQVRIAGTLSGLSPLTQIMFNKMLLYTGMYHHQKVRAVDCMLWAIFEIATSKKCEVGGRLLQTPADFLRLTDDRILIPELAKDEDIRGLIRDIRHRRLWKKALVIARNTVPDSMLGSGPDTIANTKALFAGIATLAGDEPEKFRRRRELANKIWEAAKKPCKPHEVWVDVPKPPPVREAKEMWIAAPNAQPQNLEDFIPIENGLNCTATIR
jgi:HD superfamily phosphohydrolase